MIDRRSFISSVAATVLVGPLAAESQQARKMWLIGYLSQGSRPSPSSPNPVLEAFRQGLRDLGYVEGQNLVIEYRYAC